MVKKSEQDRLRMCYCTAFECKGKMVSTVELRLHKARSEEIAQDAVLKEVERNIVKMTLLDPLATPYPNSSSSLSVDNKYSRQSSGSSNSPPRTSPGIPTAQEIPSPRGVREEEAFRVLYDFDQQIANRYNDVATVLAQWDSKGTLFRPTEARFLTRREATVFLRRESAWFSDLGARLQCTPARGDDVNRYFIMAMIERTVVIAGEIQQRLSEWVEIDTQKARSGNYYNTGE